MFLPVEASISHCAMAGLLTVAIIAAWHDWFTWRIPNSLLALACAAALMLAAFAPGSLGIAQSLEGGLAGFVLIWPFYYVGGMSAGDVKLMATLGLFAGITIIIEIALLSFLIGGVWSVIWLFSRTSAGELICARVRSLPWPELNLPKRASQPAAYTSARGVIPYGVVIAIGVIVSMLQSLWT